MYVLERRAYDAANHTWQHTYMLHEMSRSEFNAAIDAAAPNVTYYRVTAQAAHAHVRFGHPHSTTLWIDTDNRIRRA